MNVVTIAAGVVVGVVVEKTMPSYSGRELFSQKLLFTALLGIGLLYTGIAEEQKQALAEVLLGIDIGVLLVYHGGGDGGGGGPRKGKKELQCI